MDSTPRLTLQPVESTTAKVGRLLILQLVPQWDRPHSDVGTTLEYAMVSGPQGATVDPHTGLWQWKPLDVAAGQQFDVTLAVRTTRPPIQQATRTFTIDVLRNPNRSSSKESVVESSTEPTPTTLVRSDPPVVSASAPPDSGAESIENDNPFQQPADRPTLPESVTSYQLDSQILQGLEKLYQDGSLCQPVAYSAVRKLFADRFLKLHADDYQQAIQKTRSRVAIWFEKHPELRDEFLTAFDPHDDVAAGLAIMARLHDRSEQDLSDHFELAIATAVTWDRESGVYDYAVHQRRSHAVPASETPCDGLANFAYYSDPANRVSGRIRKLPWEFLIHVVNHRTPLSERGWVLRNYLDQRRPIGQCYDDLAYDHEMIKSGETTSNMAGREYTLPNLKARGGICVMQADYASRVSRCLGIPAASVEGFARSGGNHAWVMWTGLGSPTSTGLTLSLESHGRFFIDRYYVGQLLEPQTGRLITDRELELRLQTVGLNPLAHRQARLIMQAWPDLRRHLDLTVERQLDLLEAVIQLSPGNQDAWRAIAALAASGRLDPASNSRMDGLRDKCFQTFTNCPDFICGIIDDLLAYRRDLTDRLRTYDRLLQQWASTGRPDLVCRLRLQLADLLVADNQQQAALNGLAQTIKRFPDEGRYIPYMLDRYSAIAQQQPDGTARVSKLYQELLPLIPRRRQNKTSPYYRAMLTRAARYFREAGDDKLAASFEAQLKRLKE